MNETSGFQNKLVFFAEKFSPEDLKKLKHHLRIVPESEKAEEPVFEFLQTIEEKDIGVLIEELRKEGLNELTKKLCEYVNITRKISSEASECFVGREEDLSGMFDYIKDCHFPEMESRVIFVSGMPGIGKTFLVTKFYHHTMNKDFERSWISCGEMSSAISIQEAILKIFEIDTDSDNGFKQLSNKLRYLKQQTNWIIVLDEVQNVMLSDAANFDKLVIQLMRVWGQVNNSSCCLVLTSWNQASVHLREELKSGILCVNLDRMTEGESLKLINFHLRKRDMSQDEKKRLMKLCGRHPLAMELTARQFSCSPEITLLNIETTLKSHDQTYDRVLPADEEACIFNSLLHVFRSLDDSSKDLLVRLSHASENVKGAVMKKLFKQPSEDQDEIIRKSILQLKERNLVKISKLQLVSHDARYSLHPLIKNFLRVFCESDTNCPSALKQAFHESRELLLDAYRQEISKLSAEEFRGCLSAKDLSRAIVADRNNFAPELSAVLDSMALKQCSFVDFESVCQFRIHLISNRQLVANFYFERVKAAMKNNAPPWVLSFFELYFADAIRMAGDYHQAFQSFARIEKRMLSCDKAGGRENRYLKALHLRYKGRYLKDLKGRAEEAIKHFKEAEEVFKDATLFPDVQSTLAELYFDLGNIYKKIADRQWPNGNESLKHAKSYFDKVYEIYHQKDDKMPALFEVHLALASCEMELKSGSGPVEDRTTLYAALNQYEAAERVAAHNSDLIRGSDARMGDLYFSRAICHQRACEYRAALNDARQALTKRISVYGRHAKTARALILFGSICLENEGVIKDCSRKALQFFEIAYKLVVLLAMEGDFDDELLYDLNNLEVYLTITLRQFQKSDKEHKRVLQAIRNDRSNFKCDASMDNFNDEDLFNYSDVDYMESSNESESSSEDSSAASVSVARDLGASLESLMKKNAELLHRTVKQVEYQRMEYLVYFLRYRYKVESEELRFEKFTEGEKLLERLKTLENSESSFLAEHAVHFAVIIACFAFLCCICKIYL